MNPRIAFVLKTCIGASLLGWLFWRTDTGFLWRLLSGQDPAALLVATALVFLAVIFGTLKWGLLLPAEKFVRLLRLNMAANFYSLVLPGQVGAEVVKAYQLGRGRADAEAIAASVLLDKATGLLSLCALGCAGALVSSAPSGIAFRLILVCLLMCGMLMLFGLRSVKMRDFALAGSLRFKVWFPRLRRPVEQFIMFVEAWRSYLLRPELVWTSLGAGVVQQATYIGMITLLAGSLGIDLPIYEWCWIFALASTAAVLPVSLAGLGVREGVFVGLLSVFSVSPERALTLSLTIFFLQLFFGLLGGGQELLRIAKRR